MGNHHQQPAVVLSAYELHQGYTEITIIPTSSQLRTIHLHSRQATIHSVTVASNHADFVHNDAIANITVPPPADVKDCHNHPALKRRVYSALQESDEGELAIGIPSQVSLKQSHSGLQTGLIYSETATPEPQTPGAASTPEFAPITVKVEYSIRNPADGLQFVLPTDTHPFRVPHVYTTPSSPDAARCWVPCIDNIWERCTWEFQIIVPRFLEELEPSTQDDEDEDLRTPTLVVCSGELVEQITHPLDPTKTIFLFSQAVPTSVQHIAFAAGPFHMLAIPADSFTDDASASQVLMHAFCLPGYEHLLASSVTFLRLAMNHYTTEYGSYPFGSYKLVAVEEMPTQRFDSSTLTLFTADLLHGDDAIEQAMETRHSLSHALACQWIGINILPRTWSDLWLVNGLGLYINGLFLRKLLGNNEYRFRLKKDMQRVIEWDNGSMPPICQPQNLEPQDSTVLPFVNLKSPLVLHILDRRLGKSGTSLGMSRVLPKIFLSAISGEMPGNALSTHAFLRTCRKVSGVDPRSFAEQWIYGSGCPAFGFSATFNRKKMAVDITMRQEAPAYKALESNEVLKALFKPVPFFEGQMTIRIHEADGTPYEHVLDIKAPFKKYEVPFNTKYKRVRRNTKRYLARQQAAQEAAEGNTEAAEAMGMVDMGFGLDIWEKERERENWKVADWTEDDEATMSGATYEWIRIDADFEWIANVGFEQPDFMWVSQLQRDRDVVAQLEAVYALTKQPNAIISSTLTKTVLVSNYYFRIRCEAALALVTCAIRKLDFLGLFHLFKLFLKYCYEPEDANQDMFAHTYVPKPNDFSDISEYFVRKSLINAISRIRFENGKSPSVVRQFLIDQLKYNDNTSNPYSDGFYICTIISAAACATVSTNPPERGELLPTEVAVEHNEEDADLLAQTLAEIDRYRSMDRLIPSTHNIVTIAALEFYLVLTLANLIPTHPNVFFPLTREGHYTQVRIAAFDGLFLTKWYTPHIMRYILAVIANDPSRTVRRHVARNACQSLALLVTMGEMKSSSSKDTESLLIEEDGVALEKSKESKKSDMEALIKVLRKDREVGKNEIVREFLMPIAVAPDIDHEVRWCVLKLLDMLIRGVEEAPPTVKLHLPPPTPVAEAPPPSPIPSVKLPVKNHRSLSIIKTGTAPPSKSPLLPPPTSATRVKLPPSASSHQHRIIDDAPAVRIIEPGPEKVSKHHHKKGVWFTTSVPPAAAGSSSSTSKGKTKMNGKSSSSSSKPESKSAQPRKAQSSGMATNDLRACRNILKKLKAHKRAVLFMQPVDPIRDHAPSYFDVIKNPMDLATLSAKLEAGQYHDRFAFENDFRLIVSNAKLYNLDGSYAFNEAVAISNYFDIQWTRIHKTLEAADRQRPPPPPPPAPSAPPREIARPGYRILPPVPEAFPASGSGSGTHASSSAGPSRPVIKLKIGNHSKAADVEKPAPKPMPRKVKSIVSDAYDDPPPPPYIDDGSHDLLQEVMAIEREKDEVKHKKRSTASKETDTVVADVAPTKRKKRDASHEADILKTATPAKKERSATSAGPSSLTREISIAPTPSSSFSKPTIKIRRDKPDRAEESSSASGSRQASEVPRISIKGKEREVVARSPATTPAPSVKPQRSFAAQATRINEKKCRDVLKSMQKIPEAGIFGYPVDPIRDGCPTYLEEIKHPMDFHTILQNINSGRYESMEDFAKDVELVFINCRQFNPAGTYPAEAANVVERAFRKEWAKAMEKKLTWAEKRGLQSLITTLIKEDISWIFRTPVDPVLLGIPTYFDVIPRKDARDLALIKTKLDEDKYDTVDAFQADMSLMLGNAITFNGADSEVGQIALKVRSRVKELMNAWRSGSTKKRKDDKMDKGPPTKKVKIG